MKTRMISLVITAAGLLFLAGCFGSTGPARFYALSPMEQAPTGQGVKTGTSDIAVGIGPIKIADYLDRSDIVTRDTGHTVKLAEFEQWAGSFEDNFTHALAENIGFLLGSEQIYAHPWPQAVPVKYQVALEVIRFDGQLGGEAWLVARWSVSSDEPKKLLAVKRSSIQEPTGGSAYEDLVAAESRALAKLSQEIAEVILTREKVPNGGVGK
jgi:uncharacterized lipoprotein YmbA